MTGVRYWHRGTQFLGAKLLDVDTGKSTPINNKTEYNVATLDYLANGGDGFKAFAPKHGLLINGNRIDELIMKGLVTAAPKAVRPGSGTHVCVCIYGVLLAFPHARVVL